MEYVNAFVLAAHINKTIWYNGTQKNVYHFYDEYIDDVSFLVVLFICYTPKKYVSIFCYYSECPSEFDRLENYKLIFNMITYHDVIEVVAR